MTQDQIIADTIKHLKRRLAEVEATIVILERKAAQRARSKRGRKSMGAEERLEVSVRMKRYWATKGGG